MEFTKETKKWFHLCRLLYEVHSGSVDDQVFKEVNTIIKISKDELTNRPTTSCVKMTKWLNMNHKPIQHVIKDVKSFGTEEALELLSCTANRDVLSICRVIKNEKEASEYGGTILPSALIDKIPNGVLVGYHRVGLNRDIVEKIDECHSDRINHTSYFELVRDNTLNYRREYDPSSSLLDSKYMTNRMEFGLILWKCYQTVVNLLDRYMLLLNELSSVPTLPKFVVDHKLIMLSHIVTKFHKMTRDLKTVVTDSVYPLSCPVPFKMEFKLSGEKLNTYIDVMNELQSIGMHPTYDGEHELSVVMHPNAVNILLRLMLEVNRSEMYKNKIKALTKFHKHDRDNFIGSKTTVVHLTKTQQQQQSNESPKTQDKRERRRNKYFSNYDQMSKDEKEAVDSLVDFLATFQECNERRGKAAQDYMDEKADKLEKGVEEARKLLNTLLYDLGADDSKIRGIGGDITAMKDMFVEFFWEGDAEKRKEIMSRHNEVGIRLARKMEDITDRKSGTTKIEEAAANQDFLMEASYSVIDDIINKQCGFIIKHCESLDKYCKERRRNGEPLYLSSDEERYLLWTLDDPQHSWDIALSKGLDPKSSVGDLVYKFLFNREDETDDYDDDDDDVYEQEDENEPHIKMFANKKQGEGLKTVNLSRSDNKNNRTGIPIQRERFARKSTASNDTTKEQKSEETDDQESKRFKPDDNTSVIQHLRDAANKKDAETIVKATELLGEIGRKKEEEEATETFTELSEVVARDEEFSGRLGPLKRVWSRVCAYASGNRFVSTLLMFGVGLLIFGIFGYGYSWIINYGESFYKNTYFDWTKVPVAENAEELAYMQKKFTKDEASMKIFNTATQNCLFDKKGMDEVAVRTMLGEYDEPLKRVGLAEKSIDMMYDYVVRADSTTNPENIREYAKIRNAYMSTLKTHSAHNLEGKLPSYLNKVAGAVSEMRNLHLKSKATDQQRSEFCKEFVTETTNLLNSASEGLAANLKTDQSQAKVSQIDNARYTPKWEGGSALYSNMARDSIISALDIKSDEELRENKNLRSATYGFNDATFHVIDSTILKGMGPLEEALFEMKKWATTKQNWHEMLQTQEVPNPKDLETSFKWMTGFRHFTRLTGHICSFVLYRLLIVGLLKNGSDYIGAAARAKLEKWRKEESNHNAVSWGFLIGVEFCADSVSYYLGILQNSQMFLSMVFALTYLGDIILGFTMRYFYKTNDESFWDFIMVGFLRTHFAEKATEYSSKAFSSVVKSLYEWFKGAIHYIDGDGKTGEILRFAVGAVSIPAFVVKEFITNKYEKTFTSSKEEIDRMTKEMRMGFAQTKEEVEKEIERIQSNGEVIMGGPMSGAKKYVSPLLPKGLRLSKGGVLSMFAGFGIALQWVAALSGIFAAITLGGWIGFAGAAAQILLFGLKVNVNSEWSKLKAAVNGRLFWIPLLFAGAFMLQGSFMGAMAAKFIMTWVGGMLKSPELVKPPENQNKRTLESTQTSNSNKLVNQDQLEVMELETKPLTFTSQNSKPATTNPFSTNSASRVQRLANARSQPPVFGTSERATRRPTTIKNNRSFATSTASTSSTLSDMPRFEMRTTIVTPENLTDEIESMDISGTGK
jgi:hypothetical protein